MNFGCLKIFTKNQLLNDTIPQPAKGKLKDRFICRGRNGIAGNCWKKMKVNFKKSTHLQ
jgi:hypothetical protein